MRWRVRSRRCTTHPLVSVRRLAASTLCLACASLVSAFAVAASASPSLAPASLTEARAPRAPRLPFLRVGRCHGGEQRTGQHVQFERIGPGPRHQPPESLHILRIYRLCRVAPCPQFRSIFARLSHHSLHPPPPPQHA